MIRACLYLAGLLAYTTVTVATLLWLSEHHL